MNKLFQSGINYHFYCSVVECPPRTTLGASFRFPTLHLHWSEVSLVQILRPKVVTIKPSELVCEHPNGLVTAKVFLLLKRDQSSNPISFIKRLNHIQWHQQILRAVYLDFPVLFPPLLFLSPQFFLSKNVFFSHPQLGGRLICRRWALTPGCPGEPESNQSPPASDGPSVLVLGVLGERRGVYMHRKVIHLRAFMNHRRRWLGDIHER